MNILLAATQRSSGKVPSLFLLLLAPCAFAQTPMLRLDDSAWSSTHIGFGGSVALLGDVDGDGIGDLAVGCPVNGELAANAGSVVGISGRDGHRLWKLGEARLP